MISFLLMWEMFILRIDIFRLKIEKLISWACRSVGTYHFGVYGDWEGSENKHFRFRSVDMRMRQTCSKILH